MAAVEFNDWIGRSEVADPEIITARMERGLDVTLGEGRASAHSGATPGIHWCIAPEMEPPSALGRDGHPARGGFLPPIELPRRMWAGGELNFNDALQVGDEVTRTSSIQSIESKRGNSGHLCFVAVKREYATPRGIAVTERHDIVYRDEPTGASATAAAKGPAPVHERRVKVDATTLFRYSALTFNGHRIHYDHPYATVIERYPGLVIHGPLQATYLLNLATELLGALPKRFAFKSVAGAFGAQTLSLQAGARQNVDGADTLALSVVAANGDTTMHARAWA